MRNATLLALRWPTSSDPGETSGGHAARALAPTTNRSKAAKTRLQHALFHADQTPMTNTNKRVLAAEERLPRRSTGRGSHDQRHAQGSASDVAAVGGPPTERPAGRPATVLCVEDDVSTTDLVEHIFGSHPGVTVVVAHDGVRGLQLAQEQRPDLVLLDLNVGGIGGEEILETLRARPDTAALPVVILTAGANGEATGRLLATGASAVVAKPFYPEHLREIVDRLLMSTPPSEVRAPDTTNLFHEPLDPAMIAALKDLDTYSETGEGIDCLVQTALADADVRLRSIESAVTRGDTDAMIRHAHAIRGALANLGANVVAERFHDIETVARSGDLTTASIALTRVTAALAEAAEALRGHFPSDDGYR